MVRVKEHRHQGARQDRVRVHGGTPVRTSVAAGDHGITDIPTKRESGRIFGGRTKWAGCASGERPSSSTSGPADGDRDEGDQRWQFDYTGPRVPAGSRGGVHGPHAVLGRIMSKPS
jgi:hypothetical protein